MKFILDKLVFRMVNELSSTGLSVTEREKKISQFCSFTDNNIRFINFFLKHLFKSQIFFSVIKLIY